MKAPCSVDGCDRLHHAHTFCRMHLRRWKKHGDPLHEAPITGRPLKGEVPTFTAIHKRLERTRGRAADQPCVDCNQPAAEWSYDNADPLAVVGQAGPHLMAYSLDLEHYAARCVSCHRRFDGAGQRARSEHSGRFVPGGVVA